MIGGLAAASIRTPGQNPLDMIQLDLPHNAGSLGAAPEQAAFQTHAGCQEAGFPLAQTKVIHVSTLWRRQAGALMRIMTGSPSS